MMRGLAPVAISTTSASMVFCSPLPSVARTWCTPRHRADRSVRRCRREPRRRPRLQPCANVRGLGQREGLLTQEWIFGSDTEACSGSSDAEVGCTTHVGADSGGRDERLRRDTVEQHTRAADAVRIDQGDRGPVLRGYQCRLVADGSATDDHDPGSCVLQVLAWPAGVSRRPVSRCPEHHVSRSACTGARPGGPLRHTLGPRFRLAPVSIYAAYGSNMHPEQMLLRCLTRPCPGQGGCEAGA